MCDFCNETKEKGFEYESPCVVKNDDGEYEVYFHGLYEEYFKINYCPMCGRKLVE